MLVLSRNIGKEESIIIQTPIGDTLEITLLRMDKGRVRVGIDAPKEYIVLRNELLKRSLEENDKPMEAAKAEN